MAARRGKSQAKRNNSRSNESLPGWVYGVLGLIAGVVLILVVPKYLKSEDGDGFFRPKPNPDAQPALVAEEAEPVAPEGDAPARPAPAAGKDKDKDAKPAKDGTDYAFYDMLPGKEVEMSDAELAATEAAEEQRRAAQQRRSAQAGASSPAAPAAAPVAANLPKPVDPLAPAPQPAAPAASAPQPAPVTPRPPTVAASTGPAPAAAGSTAVATAPKPAAAADDNTRYLLQAGAFQASGQAEEMKAKIAMLGLGARVESAQIGGKTVYRVRMGPYGTASDLAEAKRKLADGGLPGMAIKVQ